MRNMYSIALSLLLIPLAACAMMPQNTGSPSQKSENPYGYTTESPPALIVNGHPLDPLCMLHDWSAAEGEGVSYFPVENCRKGDNIQPSATQPIKSDKYVSQSYTVTDTYEEGGQPFTSSGFIAYRYLGEYQGYKAIITEENTGGSGIFSTLALYDLKTMQLPDGQPQKVLQLMRRIDGGDRCNGGIASGEISGGNLRHQLHLTPLATMTLFGDPDRPVLDTKAAKDLPYCAICCYAKAEYVNGDFVSLNLNEDIISGQMASDGSEGPAETCFKKLVKEHAAAGNMALDKVETKNFVENIEKSCLASAERQ